MRENRPHGSEGGEGRKPFPTPTGRRREAQGHILDLDGRSEPEAPLCAAEWRCVREGALSAGCESPTHEVASCVVECNCVAARRGGEQQETNRQPVG